MLRRAETVPRGRATRRSRRSTSRPNSGPASSTRRRKRSTKRSTSSSGSKPAAARAADQEGARRKRTGAAQEEGQEEAARRSEEEGADVQVEAARLRRTGAGPRSGRSWRRRSPPAGSTATSRSSTRPGCPSGAYYVESNPYEKVVDPYVYHLKDARQSDRHDAYRMVLVAGTRRTAPTTSACRGSAAGRTRRSSTTRA